MTEEIRKSILQVEIKGRDLYLEFRMERLIQKNKSLFDTIHRHNIKTFQSINDSQIKQSMKSKRKLNDSAAGYRLLDISQARGYDTKQLFQYDLVTTNYLFDEEGLMTKPAKYMLVNEIEKSLEPVEREASPASWKETQTAYIVDVMANIRKLRISGLRTFNDLCTAFARCISALSRPAKRIDFVFDSYIEGSIKDNERSRRSRYRPIEVNMVNEDTPLPVNMDTFWASGSNKVKLQILLSKWIRQNANNIWPNVELVLSSTVIDGIATDCIAVNNGNENCIESLKLRVEEADVRIVPHAINIANHGY
ncbi:uncharacterized protein LOC127871907 isoform X2 [Dreissena polymorpha]|uniref:uncharacterized protein LOC127871907 isoform X2 n=1 Tax=Dreissena polymorpha TaxID=45954 RepID=UPI0022656C6D|nr:uncharacterized protein LOC127871907 isoform X2 [Dreissena polymorpha]